MAQDSDRAPCLKTHCESSYSDSILDGFSAMQEKQEMTDFVIKTQKGRSIHVHKMLLNSTSEYFRCLFRSGMKESRCGEMTLDNVRDCAVMGVVDYLYGRTITIQWKDLEHYMRLADMLQVSSLKDEIDSFILCKMSPRNCLHCYHLAATYSMIETLDKARLMIASHFDEVCASNKDLRLAEMLAILQDENIVGLLEDDMTLKVSIEWALWKEEERKDDFVKLVECVDMENCSANYLAHVLEKYEGRLINTMSLYGKISKAMASKTLKSKDVAGGGKFILIGGMVDRTQVVRDIITIDLDKQCVEAVDKKAPAAIFSSVTRCATQSAVFCARSRNGRVGDGGVLYDLVTGTRKIFRSTRYALKSAVATSVGEEVYLVGEEDESIKIGCLNMTTGQWRGYSTLSSGKSFSSVCAIGRTIFALIFSSPLYTENDFTLDRYDTERDEWSPCSSPDRPVIGIRNACAVPVWNKIYFVGGIGSVCVSYSTLEDKWYTHKPPSQKHDHGTAVHVNGKIVLCGGSFSDVIEIYDIHSNTWQTSHLKLPKAQNFSIAVQM